MDELIEAMQIFKKYTDGGCPVRGQLDEICVEVPECEVSPEDAARLIDIGFTWDAGWRWWSKCYA